MVPEIVGNDTTTNSAGNVNRYSELTSEDFIKIMMTELTNQDPTEPQDSGALMGQIESLRSIESNMNLMSEISNLVGQNQFASAANLIGKFVVGHDENQQAIQGNVKSAGVEGDKIILTLESGERMSFDSVEHISGNTGSGGDDLPG